MNLSVEERQYLEEYINDHYGKNYFKLYIENKRNFEEIDEYIRAQPWVLNEDSSFDENRDQYFEY